jgi:MYXO-CTERM domain-containing protein
MTPSATDADVPQADASPPPVRTDGASPQADAGGRHDNGSGGSCGCRLAGGDAGEPWLLVAGGLLAGLLRTRRRRRP